MSAKKTPLILVVLLIAVIAISTVIYIIIYTNNNSYTAHEVLPAASFNDNPLRGFVPFSNSFTEFPHSLEFFYIPMSAMYPDPDSTPETEPDWTEMEKQLNTIAARGNQAIFRVYLDYPSQDDVETPVGIPKFLLKEPYNLKIRDYGVFSNYISKLPDYSNPYLRETIKNFIAAMGRKYDGDPRIGFITAGILGFWGEWHCWPYDGVTMPQNYEPPAEVFDEVTEAYDKAFKKTRIVFRYPKGIVSSKTHFGFHDDSYCFETIPVALGGNDYNFAEKLKNAQPSCENRWQTAPIGGELRPEIQETIFRQKPFVAGEAAPFENWDDNLRIVHPSWMINEAIKLYTGETRENALEAASQLGYDFQVTTAYYKDDIRNDSRIHLSVDIRNIGIAPFYYDNTTWPVKVGIKQGDKLITSWTTDWDLSKIMPDGNIVNLKSVSPQKIHLDDGWYSICIMVENPLPNGSRLGFANKYQYDDGWLDLGFFSVNQGGNMPRPERGPEPVHQPKQRPEQDVVVSEPGVYEAEASNNTLEGIATIGGGKTFSGNQYVGYIGNGEGTLQFNNVYVEKDGTYTLVIYYVSAEPRSAFISINGAEGFQVDYEPSGSWSKVAEKEVTVELKAGDNTIKFYNDYGWAASVDKIAIR